MCAAGKYFRKTETDNSVARVVRRPGIPSPYVSIDDMRVKVKGKSHFSERSFSPKVGNEIRQRPPASRHRFSSRAVLSDLPFPILPPTISSMNTEGRAARAGACAEI